MPRIGLVAIVVVGCLLTAIGVGLLFDSKSGSSLPEPNDHAKPLPPQNTPQEPSNALPADEGKKWYIVKATSASRYHCEATSNATWHNDRVIAWLGANAVVVDIDVDREKTTAAFLSIDARVDTIIAFKDDKEFDRLVGYPSPRALLYWLEGIERGETSIKSIPTRTTIERDEKAIESMGTRWQRAKSLVDAGRYEEAADEYTWLWEHMPSAYLCRPEKFTDESQQLVGRSFAAWTKFEALRAVVARRLELDRVSAEDVFNWIDLNRLVSRRHDTLAWFDRLKTNRRRAPLIELARHEIGDLLIEEHRWAELGRVYPDPMFMLEEHHCTDQDIAMHAYPPGRYDAAEKVIREMRKYEISVIYAGLLASGQESAAAAFAAKAREYFAAGRTSVAMVRSALSAGQSRQVHVEWLLAEPNDEDAASLLKHVQKALRQKLFAQTWC